MNIASAGTIAVYKTNACASEHTRIRIAQVRTVCPWTTKTAHAGIRCALARRVCIAYLEQDNAAPAKSIMCTKFRIQGVAQTSQIGIGWGLHMIAGRGPVIWTHSQFIQRWNRMYCCLRLTLQLLPILLVREGVTTITVYSVVAERSISITTKQVVARMMKCVFVARKLSFAPKLKGSEEMKHFHAFAGTMCATRTVPIVSKKKTPARISRYVQRRVDAKLTPI